MLMGELAMGVPGCEFSHWVVFMPGVQSIGGPTVVPLAPLLATPPKTTRVVNTPVTTAIAAATVPTVRSADLERGGELWDRTSGQRRSLHSIDFVVVNPTAFP